MTSACDHLRYSVTTAATFLGMGPPSLSRRACSPRVSRRASSPAKYSRRWPLVDQLRPALGGEDLLALVGLEDVQGRGPLQAVDRRQAALRAGDDHRLGQAVGPDAAAGHDRGAAAADQAHAGPGVD